MSRPAASKPFPGGGRILHRLFTRLDCPGRPPHFVVEFYPYTDLSHTIRLRDDTAYVRFSDVLRAARLPVLEAAAALLLARLYRRRVPRELLQLYRRFSISPGVRRRLAHLRRQRGQNRATLRPGVFFDLTAAFERLNQRYFGGKLPRPQLAWSARPWRTQLGCYESSLNQIILNRKLDRSAVPPFAVEYVLFHEMLHLKHPIRAARCGFQAHSPAFRREELRFAHFERARRFLARLA